VLARWGGVQVYFSTGPRISPDQKMPLSSDGKERRRVAPKEKRKRSKSFTLHLVWVKRVCVIQTISPGED